MTTITVNQKEIRLLKGDLKDFISLTDMANAKDVGSRAADIIKNWLRTRFTLEFLGTWEMINNPNFKVVESDHFKSQAGMPSFVMSVSEWISSTGAIGFYVKKGKYGGTYAHKDIAFEFGSAISVQFKLYLIKEFQRHKEKEIGRLNWSAKRELAKVNYHIHTQAIKEHLIPQKITPTQASMIYANEADILNMALFCKTAKKWRQDNPTLFGNMRDYAQINELICLSNLENINALLIDEGVSQTKRLIKLNQIAIKQMTLLQNVDNRKLISEM